MFFRDCLNNMNDAGGNLIYVYLIQSFPGTDFTICMTQVSNLIYVCLIRDFFMDLLYNMNGARLT